MIADPRARPAGTGTVLLLAFAWLAATMWLRPLMLPDEGRYVGVAWEMLRSGHWLVPTLDGLPYFHKPPLFYWITAASLSVFGVHEWAARAAPFLGAAAATAALYLFALRWNGRALARVAVLVLVTQPLLFAAAQFANLDMLVAGCISVTVLALASAALAMQEGRPARGALLTGYAFAALGLLAKGLIGIVLPGMVLVAWLLVTRRPRLILRLVSVPGLLLFLAIGAPWFIAMQQRFPEFANYFFIVQHFKRYTTAGFNNPEPFWFYFALLPLATLPWSAWLARRAYWRDQQRSPVRILMWMWLALVTLFFSLPKSKLIGYILPVCVPLAWLVADALVLALRSDAARPRRWLRASVAVAAVVCLVSITVAFLAPNKSLRDLGRVLARGMAPGDQVVFLHGYYFDVPFNARLRAPATVVENWNDPRLTSRDDWRRELADAQRFRPESGVLALPDELPKLLCASHGTWLVGDASMRSRYPMLTGVPEVARHRDVVLWHLPASGVSAGQCPGTPIASSAGR